MAHGWLAAATSSTQSSAAIKIALGAILLLLVVALTVVQLVRRLKRVGRMHRASDDAFAFLSNGESYHLRGRRYVGQFQGRNLEAMVLPPSRHSYPSLQLHLSCRSPRTASVSSGVNLPPFLKPLFQWDAFDLQGPFSGLRGGGDRSLIDSLANSAECVAAVMQLMQGRNAGWTIFVVLEKETLSLRVQGLDLEALRGEDVKCWLDQLVYLATALEQAR